jgi:hypothetical protein
MKQLKIKSLFFLLAVVSLTSCLKKDPMNVDTSAGVANVVEFANTGNNVAGSLSKYPRFAKDLGSMALGDTVSFNINVSYSGVDVAPQDITVTLAVDTAALGTYNRDNSTSYVTPPTDLYKMPTSVVIKQGTHQTTIKAVITRTSSFDFGVNYALPLKIASASQGVISGNFGKALYSFAARNSYDGIYVMEATAPMVDLAAPTIVGWYPIDMQLITYTGNSIALYDGPNIVKDYGHPIKNGAAGSYYGTFSPVFFFDATGKITSVTNYFGQNAGGNKRSAQLDPSGVNKATFNASGKIVSFEVAYIMTQSVSTPDAPRTYFHEKFTYKAYR